MTEITADDEREARKWLNDATAYPTSRDLEKRHRATIIALLDAVEASQRETRTVPDDVVLTLVSQARQRSRDAALEEAAAIADRFAKFTKQAVCVDISDRIRALRSKP